MTSAGRRGHIDVVKKLIDEKGEDYFSIGDFNDVLFQASWGGHLDIVKLMVKKGANDFNMAIRNATLTGQQEIVDYLNDILHNDKNQSMN